MCRRTGILFVADCVINAFGRLGEWFGPARFGVRPDMITFAKGVTSGYVPLGGVVIDGRLAEPMGLADELLRQRGADCNLDVVMRSEEWASSSDRPRARST